MADKGGRSSEQGVSGLKDDDTEKVVEIPEDTLHSLAAPLPAATDTDPVTFDSCTELSGTSSRTALER